MDRAYRTRAGAIGRDAQLRQRYLDAALPQIPRLLTLVDRNPLRKTYGCFDRSFWHYRTSDFPSGMYQEAVLPLALAWAFPFEGSPWFRRPRIRELALAGMRFAVRAAHADGSCDDYYPYERALGATVFSLYACVEAYRLLEVHDLEILAGLERRARWLLAHDESGRLANHQAWAALTLYLVYELTGDPGFLAGAELRLRTVLQWQALEGWFQEYDGCDPGYLAVTIDALAKYYRLTRDPVVREALHHAVAFARHFLHPDDSYAGHYGSRGTAHFYPHGMEILSLEQPAAAELAEGFLRSLGRGTAAAFDDDRMFTHRLPNLLQAYLDWSGGNEGALQEEQHASARTHSWVAQACPKADPSSPNASAPSAGSETHASEPIDRYFSGAQIYVRRSEMMHAVVACGKGATFKLFQKGLPPVSDTGLMLQMEDQRVCVAHLQGEYSVSVEPARLSVSGPMHWVRHETASPLKQVLFRVGLGVFGRRRAQRVRRYLQRRLITGRQPAPVLFRRVIQWGPPIEVIDELELADPKSEVRSLAIASDASSIYTAAGAIYQASEFADWVDLNDWLAELNHRRRIVVCRVWDAPVTAPVSAQPNRPMTLSVRN